MQKQAELQSAFARNLRERENLRTFGQKTKSLSKRGKTRESPYFLLSAVRGYFSKETVEILI